MDTLTIGGVAAALLFLTNAVWAQISPRRQRGDAIDLVVLGIVAGAMILLAIAH